MRGEQLIEVETASATATSQLVQELLQGEPRKCIHGHRPHRSLWCSADIRPDRWHKYDRDDASGTDCVAAVLGGRTQAYS